MFSCLVSVPVIADYYMAPVWSPVLQKCMYFAQNIPLSAQYHNDPSILVVTVFPQTDLLACCSVSDLSLPATPTSQDGSQAGPSTEDAPEQPPSPAADSQVKRRISDGIQALMSRLNLGREAAGAAKTDDTIAPLHLDMYCNNNAG